MYCLAVDETGGSSISTILNNTKKFACHPILAENKTSRESIGLLSQLQGSALHDEIVPSVFGPPCGFGSLYCVMKSFISNTINNRRLFKPIDRFVSLLIALRQP